jgi:hypothetical protein
MRVDNTNPTPHLDGGHTTPKQAERSQPTNWHARTPNTLSLKLFHTLQYPETRPIDTLLSHAASRVRRDAATSYLRPQLASFLASFPTLFHAGLGNFGFVLQIPRRVGRRPRRIPGRILPFSRPSPVPWSTRRSPDRLPTSGFSKNNLNYLNNDIPTRYPGQLQTRRPILRYAARAVANRWGIPHCQGST